MTYEEAEALIREHMDYGGGIKVQALAAAIAESSLADAAGASEAYRKALSAVNNSRTIYEAEVYLQRLLVAAIAKESGNE